MYSFNGFGYKIIIEEIDKVKVQIINSLFEKKQNTFQEHSNNVITFFGFDISKTELFKNFNSVDINILYDSKLIQPIFDADKIYMITIEEYVGDIFSFEKLKEIKATILSFLDKSICIDIGFKVEESGTKRETKQLILFHKAGKIQEAYFYEKE